MQSNGKIALGIFVTGIIFTLAAIVLGLVQMTDWSVAIGIAGCTLCIPGFYFAFESWKDEPEAEEIVEELPKIK